MAKVDTDKFIALLVETYCLRHGIDRKFAQTYIDDVLEQMGFKVENGEIVELKKSPAVFNEMLDRPLTDYPLSVRALNCLKVADINTLRELVRLTEMDYRADINVNSFKNTLIDLFPELKIRKELIAIFKGQIPYTSEEDGKKYIAWLEKTGEHLKFCKTIQKGKSALEAIKEEKVDNANKVELKDYNDIDPHFGKPIDKVEPKFKVKYAGSEYNVLEVKDSAGITFYGIKDEPNHIDYVKAENCEIISGYAIKENGSPYPTKTAVFSEQNHAWSEEDEVKMNRIVACLETLNVADYDILLKDVDWLKSLKERVGCEVNCTTTKEWSVEDRSKIQRICKYLDEAKKYYADITEVRDCMEWLKSLTPQPTWKPSEKQIEALKEATNIVGSKYKSCLNSLYSDLKKLREE